MPSGITINPGFKNMSRADLDKVAKLDYGLDPEQYNNIDEITQALQEAYDAETGTADGADDAAAKPEDNADLEAANAEIEALKAQIEALQSKQATTKVREPEAVSTKVVQATKKAPWVTNDRT